jgi:hypothetical protein
MHVSWGFRSGYERLAQVATPAEVHAYRQDLIDYCAPGGGFFLGGECKVPWDSKPENIRAMIYAAERHGRYYGDPREEPVGSTAGGRGLLAGIRTGLNPPTREEVDLATARWLFGENAEKMMRHAPWSFVLIKLMWQRGEEPWKN